MSFDTLGDRMKSYENIPRIALEKKKPVIIRLDGKAFHSFTKGMLRPFDDVLISAMQKTAAYLCENVMGCKIAYTQSDEISLLLIDYEREETQAWFDNSLQKMVSVASSMATMAFNKFFAEEVHAFGAIHATIVGFMDTAENDKLHSAYYKAMAKGAMFDARAFVLPQDEVCNYFIWRQQDAMRNSVLMVAQSLYSPKKMHGKTCQVLKELMLEEEGVDWNDYPTYQRRGTCIVKEQYDKEGTMRSRWVPDLDIPVFTEDRDYINKYVFLNKEMEHDGQLENG